MNRFLSFPISVSILINIISFSYGDKGSKCLSSQSLLVEVEQGTLRGVPSISRGGKEYRSFYGIPFAKPPIGDLRFEPPVEPEPWQGVRNTTTPPPVCMQSELTNISFAGETFIRGQEDCLYLNVFTPNVKISSLLPVLIYIHGGAFHSGGSASFGPQYFMDYPCVLVTISYRLAIFGFLSAVDDILPGNYGFKDQTAALRWVRKNIAAFGGDPNRVTLSGQSTGGRSVHFHLFSHSSTGLFHQAISQSGAAFTPGIINPHTARERARALGVLTGCPNLETKALVKCLRKVPAEQLVLAHEKFFVYDRNPSIVFGPVIEPKSEQNAFITEHPWRTNIVNSVPYILGVNADDGTVIASRILSIPAVLREWSLNYYRMFPLMFSYFNTTDSRTSSALTTSIKEFYFGNENIGFQTSTNFRQMFGDGYYGTAGLEAAVRHPNRVYFYLYDHLNARSYDEGYGNTTLKHGAAHGDELLSLYYLNGIFPPVTEGPDYAVSQRMLNYWVNFVSTGNPNGEVQIWRPFSAQKFEYLHITTDRDVTQKGLLLDRYAFWRYRVYPYIYNLKR